MFCISWLLFFVSERNTDPGRCFWHISVRRRTVRSFPIPRQFQPSVFIDKDWKITRIPLNHWIITQRSLLFPWKENRFISLKRSTEMLHTALYIKTKSRALLQSFILTPTRFQDHHQNYWFPETNDESNGKQSHGEKDKNIYSQRTNRFSVSGKTIQRKSLPCHCPPELPNVMVEHGLKRCKFKLVVADVSMPLVLMSHNRVCKQENGNAYDEPE